MVDLCSAKYPLETHYVQTEDDYTVTLLRICSGSADDVSHDKDTKIKIDQDLEDDGLRQNNGKSKPKPAVLLVHGIMCNGDEWLINSVENVLPYRLVNEGYDCWLACLRGSRLSSSKPHATLSRDCRKYWDFSIDELAGRDLPAMLDYILELTSNESLYYVGHSLGNTALFAMMSLKPEYNSKIKVMAALSPAVYGKHVTKILIKLGRPFIILMSKIKIGYRREICGKSTARSIKTVCPCIPRSEKFAVWIMKKLGKMAGIMGDDQIEKERFIDIVNHSPGSTSLKTLCHCFQCFSAGNLQAYDYGRNGNMKRYGQPTPPIYDLKNVTVPVATFTSSSDGLIPAKDVLQVSKELPNLISHLEICETKFHHVDFMYGKDANKLIYDDIVKIFKNYGRDTK